MQIPADRVQTEPSVTKWTASVNPGAGETPPTLKNCTQRLFQSWLTNWLASVTASYRCLDSEKILSHGDASTDIKCGIDPPHPQPAPSHPVKNPERPGNTPLYHPTVLNCFSPSLYWSPALTSCHLFAPVLTDQSISLAVYVVAMILMAFIIILTIIVLTIKIHHIKKKTKTTRQETNAKTTTPSEKFPIIMPPTGTYSFITNYITLYNFYDKAFKSPLLFLFRWPLHTDRHRVQFPRGPARAGKQHGVTRFQGILQAAHRMSTEGRGHGFLD